MRSFSYYIALKIEEAIADNAPADAIFKKDGVWICVSDLDEDHEFRRWYENQK
jgi:hypothetical protein